MGYASGRNSGIALSCGDGVIQTIPVINGFTHYPAIRRINFGGRDITHYLAKLLSRRGHYFHTFSDLETVREIKEKFCFVAKNFEEERERARTSSALEVSFELPDGRTLDLGEERFQCMEALFNPALIHQSIPAVHELVYDAIMSCDIHQRALMFGNIVITGGTTLA